jgi:uncharacterized protein (TIGR02246 family)
MRSRSDRRRVVVACLVIGACAAQQSSTTVSPRAAQVRAQIEQAVARFSEAFNRGDVAAVAAMYDTGAVVLAPNAPPMRGRQNIEALWAGARQQGFRNRTLVVNSVELIDGHAIELGSYTLVIQPPGQAETIDRGKYLVVWKRQVDGTWKLYRDAFNTSMPPR